MTLIYDPIEALQRIQELVKDDIDVLNGNTTFLRSKVEAIQSVVCNLNEVSLICDTVLFSEGLKER